MSSIRGKNKVVMGDEEIRYLNWIYDKIKNSSWKGVQRHLMSSLLYMLSNQIKSYTRYFVGRRDHVNEQAREKDSESEGAVACISATLLKEYIYVKKHS